VFLLALLPFYLLPPLLDFTGIRNLPLVMLPAIGLLVSLPLGVLVHSLFVRLLRHTYEGKHAA
jgi:hypothetical protein